MKCPTCATALALLIEPAALEFYCANDHAFDLETLVARQAEEARGLLEDALAFWRAKQEELLRDAEASRADAPVAAAYERRARVAAERVLTLQRALQLWGPLKP